MKYAFIMNSASLNPDTYSVIYEYAGNQDYYTAVHGMKMTRELVKKLASDGYEQIDLCGAYNSEKAEEIRKASESNIRVNYAKYSEEDLEKFNALESTSKYGIIAMGFDMTEDMVRLELTSEEYNTYIAIVANEETAALGAKKMVEEGINFIELCGYFDSDKAEKVAEAIGHKVPIGYCG
ncbi:MAG: DUF6506 family protein [Bacillota bacterium]